MKKQITSLGFEIPGFSEHFHEFTARYSLMDADILLISPESLRPLGEWIRFNAGGGCYDVQTSESFMEKVSQLKKEIFDHLSSGKNAFVLLGEKIEFTLGKNVTYPRKGQRTIDTLTLHNYSFLPIDIGQLTNATGKHFTYTGNSDFSIFDENFRTLLEYELYIENPPTKQIIYTGKNSKKILAAVYQVEKGQLVLLPNIKYDEDEFVDTKKGKNGQEEEIWNKKGVAFGHKLVNSLLDIDSKLTENSLKTPPPDWTTTEQFISKREASINNSISENQNSILKIQSENEKLKIELAEEQKIKDLLFEKGKPLEFAVIKILKMLGYEAENYDDGSLEIDQVILSPENHRYIGECEGKDSKDIDITKFRQLQDALNADFAREQVTEKAFGILFGNAERLKPPHERALDFTLKCKNGAEREKIALIKTADLFYIGKYLSDNNDEDYKKSCREAIHEQLGKIVKFPKVPTI